MMCDHYRCSISERGCVKRQTVTPFRAYGIPVDYYCTSGKCAQGRKVREENPDMPPPRGRRLRRTGIKYAAARKLNRLLRVKNMTLHTLAKQVGCSESHIRNLNAGRRESPGIKKKIADRLGAAPADIWADA